MKEGMRTSVEGILLVCIFLLDFSISRMSLPCFYIFGPRTLEDPLFSFRFCKSSIFSNYCLKQLSLDAKLVGMCCHYIRLVGTKSFQWCSCIKI